MADIQDLDPVDDNNQQTWPENTMVVNQLNNAGRADEGLMSRWYLDTNGFLVTAGAGDEYTITPTRTVSAYEDGLGFRVQLDRANTTTTPTFKVGALPAVAIKKFDGTDPEIGELPANAYVFLTYRGTDFIVSGIDSDTDTTYTAGNGLQLNAEEFSINEDVVSTKVRTRNAQTGTAYTLALTDAGNVVTMNNAAANTLEIPLNATVAFLTDTQIDTGMLGAGVTTIDAVAGATLNGIDGGSCTIQAQYGAATLVKIGTDAWWVFGNISEVA